MIEPRDLEEFDPETTDMPTDTSSDEPEVGPRDDDVGETGEESKEEQDGPTQ